MGQDFPKDGIESSPDQRDWWVKSCTCPGHSQKSQNSWWQEVRDGLTPLWQLRCLQQHQDVELPRQNEESRKPGGNAAALLCLCREVRGKN